MEKWSDTVHIKRSLTTLLHNSRQRSKLPNSSGKHSSLQNAEGQYPKPGQSSVYEHLFQTTFDAHDALGDLMALRRILFPSRLALSDEMLVNRSSVISVKDAAGDLKYLHNRHQRLLSFRGELYNPVHADSPIKKKASPKKLLAVA